MLKDKKVTYRALLDKERPQYPGVKSTYIFLTVIVDSQVYLGLKEFGFGTYE